MDKFVGFRCSLCAAEYAPNEVEYTCPVDGGNLDIVLDLPHIREQINPEKFQEIQERSLWRYLPLLPVGDPGGYHTPLRSAGWTPVYRADSLAKHLDLKTLWIKDEGRNPTASFKDRASAVVVAHAMSKNANAVVTASTGNAGAALAGMAAAIGQQAIILAPRTAPQAKIAQLLTFGAKVILVDANYDAAFDLSVAAAQEFGWYCRNTGYNPFTAEGKKTAAFEIWETLLLKSTGQPLNVFVSVGDGNIISGIHKGFRDLYDLGWLETMPRLFGVQSEGSSAVSNAFLSGNEVISQVISTTIADSISVDLPRDGVRALRAVKQTGGSYIIVSDTEILAAIPQLGSMGVFSEPAGSAAYAGLIKALQTDQIDPEETVLVINTGNGLKDVRAAMQSVPSPSVIEPSLRALQELMASE